jgi:hypothetical protein
MSALDALDTPTAPTRGARLVARYRKPLSTAASVRRRRDMGDTGGRQDLVHSSHTCNPPRYGCVP